MKTLKTIIELMAWALLYSPMYFLFTFLDRLISNSLAMGNEARSSQLTVLITIMLVACGSAYFLIEWILYRRELINRHYDRAETVKRGRGVFSKLFNNKYRTYIDSGCVYWIDNKTRWLDSKGNEIGRISWIDSECEKKRIRARLKH